MRKAVMVTGMQAAGKTTIGPLLAARLSPPAAAFDGDTFYRMVVLGNVNMTPECPPEAMRQVCLRYQAAALVAQHYADAAERELARGTNNSYRDWQKPGMTLIEAIESMQIDLKQTPRRGLWLDTSGQTPQQTVESILADGMRRSRY
jgi:hypothetical protein